MDIRRKSISAWNSECRHLKHKHAWHVQGRTKRTVWLEGSKQEVETRGTAETGWKDK